MSRADVVAEVEAFVQQSAYRTVWETLAPGETFECQYGVAVSLFRVRQRIPEGLIADMVSEPRCQGVVLELWSRRTRYVRRVSVAPSLLIPQRWAWLCGLGRRVRRRG